MRILAYWGDLEAGRGNDKQKLAYYEESLALARKLKDQYFIGELENRLPNSLRRHPAKVFNIVELLKNIAYSLNILKVFRLCLKLAKILKGLMRGEGFGEASQSMTMAGAPDRPTCRAEQPAHGAKAFAYALLQVCLRLAA